MDSKVVGCTPQKINGVLGDQLQQKLHCSFCFMGIPGVQHKLGHESGQDLPGAQSAYGILRSLLQHHNGTEGTALSRDDRFRTVCGIAVGQQTIGKGTVVAEELCTPVSAPELGLGGLSGAGGGGEENALVADTDLGGVEGQHTVVQENPAGGEHPQNGAQGIHGTSRREIEPAGYFPQVG